MEEFLILISVRQLVVSPKGSQIPNDHRILSRVQILSSTTEGYKSLLLSDDHCCWYATDLWSSLYMVALSYPCSMKWEWDWHRFTGGKHQIMTEPNAPRKQGYMENSQIIQHVILCSQAKVNLIKAKQTALIYSSEFNSIWIIQYEYCYSAPCLQFSCANIMWHVLYSTVSSLIVFSLFFFKHHLKSII